MTEIRGQNNYTTMAIGEEGGDFTSVPVREEGQDICPSCIEINNYTLILQLLITLLKRQICNIGLGIGIPPTL
jgi:hypothetical protein